MLDTFFLCNDSLWRLNQFAAGELCPPFARSRAWGACRRGPAKRQQWWLDSSMGIRNNLLIIYDYMGMDQIAYEIPFCWSISRCSMIFFTLTNSIPTVSGKIMGHTGNYHAMNHVISHFRGWTSTNPGDWNRRTVIPRRSSNTAQGCLDVFSGCLDVRYSWLMGCPTKGYKWL